MFGHPAWAVLEERVWAGGGGTFWFKGPGAAVAAGRHRAVTAGVGRCFMQPRGLALCGPGPSVRGQMGVWLRPGLARPCVSHRACPGEGGAARAGPTPVGTRAPFPFT